MAKFPEARLSFKNFDFLFNMPSNKKKDPAAISISLLLLFFC
jgi:hypothetical protein